MTKINTLIYFIISFSTLSLILIFIIFKIKHFKENWIPQTNLGYPFVIPIPKQIKTWTGFVNYDDVDFKKLCPTDFPSKKTCKENKECGLAEICYGYDENNKHCICSIKNKCMYDAVC